MVIIPLKVYSFLTELDQLPSLARATGNNRCKISGAVVWWWRFYLLHNWTASNFFRQACREL